MFSHKKIIQIKVYAIIIVHRIEDSQLLLMQLVLQTDSKKDSPSPFKF